MISQAFFNPLKQGKLVKYVELREMVVSAKLRKSKLSLGVTKHYAMKTCGEVDV